MLQAIGDKVIVKLIYQEKTSNLIIPKSAVHHRKYFGQVLGKVVSIGPKYPYRDDLKPRDTIIFTRHEGKKPYKGDWDYRVLKPRWVLAKVEAL